MTNGNMIKDVKFKDVGLKDVRQAYFGEFNIQDFIIPKLNDEDLRKRLEDKLYAFLKKETFYIHNYDGNYKERFYAEKFYNALLKLTYDRVSPRIFDIRITCNIDYFSFEIPRFTAIDMSNITKHVAASVNYTPPGSNFLKLKKNDIQNQIVEYTNRINRLTSSEPQICYKGVKLSEEYFKYSSEITTKQIKDIRNLLGFERQSVKLDVEIDTNKLHINNESLEAYKKYFDKGDIYLILDNKPIPIIGEGSIKTITHDISNRNMFLIGEYKTNIYLIGPYIPQSPDNLLMKELQEKKLII